MRSDLWGDVHIKRWVRTTETQSTHPSTHTQRNTKITMVGLFLLTVVFTTLMHYVRLELEIHAPAKVAHGRTALARIPPRTSHVARRPATAARELWSIV